MHLSRKEDRTQINTIKPIYHHCSFSQMYKQRDGCAYLSDNKKMRLRQSEDCYLLRSCFKPSHALKSGFGGQI